MSVSVTSPDRAVTRQQVAYDATQSMLMHQELIYQRHNRVVYELDGKHILKIGKGNPNEAETMSFVRKHTTLPVPEVINYWTHDENNYILMQKMPGETLESIWSTLSADVKRSIMLQLRGYVEEMRKLEFGHIGAVNRKPTMEYLISDDAFGPLDTLDDFYKVRFSQFPLEGVFAEYAATQRIFKDVKFVLCHNDLGPYNILVKDGTITAILDWELSGSYPEYWEYTRNTFHCGYGKEWRDELKKILEQWGFDDEIKRLEWFISDVSVFTNECNDDKDKQLTKEYALRIISGKDDIELELVL
jgi:serine/threonine protein kinase